MSKKKKPVIAICYDFDGTLSPQYMQEYDFIPKLGIKAELFWQKATQLAKEREADPILTYMSLMVEEAGKNDKVTITEKDFISHGKAIGLFPGVEGWFDRINKYGAAQGAVIEHYIISSGLKEMIRGSSVSKYFKKIYASSFAYDKHGIARWPANAVNYTTKTQFLFRINKGALDLSDNRKINEYVAEDERPVPFKRMIFIGDGETDVPCMKLVKEMGGYSVGVYRPRSQKAIVVAKKLVEHDRVNLAAPADYRKDALLDIKIKKAINKMMAEYNLNDL
jgi:hypothetical protein